MSNADHVLIVAVNQGVVTQPEGHSPSLVRWTPL
jgi:hypothetical protein